MTWTIPIPRAAGYALNPVEQTIRTDMEVGAARVRRRSSARLDKFDVSWNFSEDDFQSFRTWFETTLAGGVAWFSIQLVAGKGGMITETARFAGPWKADFSDRRWIVTARLEVR